MARVKRVGGGMLLVKTEVFRKLAEAHPEWRFRVNEIYFYGNPVPKREWQYDFFQFGTDSKTHQYRSEDWFFLDEARKLGFDTYILPTARTIHTGSMDFVWNLPAMATLQQHVARAR